MLRIRTINSAAIAYFFLASLLGAYGTYFVCNTDLLSHESSDHSHDESHRHYSASNDQPANAHDHSDSSNEDCCNDLTSSFFNDAKLLTKQIKVDLSSSVIPTLSQSTFDNPFALRNDVNFTFYIDPPPKSVPYSILFQSFLI